MTTYQVRAKRWARGWELHIDGVGVTQARRLNDAETMARDYIAMDLDLAEDAFDVEVAEIEVDEETDSLAHDALQAVEDAQRAQVAAAQRVSETVQRLTRDGLTNREIARYLDVSPQRISQITKKLAGADWVDVARGRVEGAKEREAVRS